MSDIQELFNRDPNKCSDQDIMAIIEEYRKRHTQFNTGVMTAGNVKPKATKAKKPGVPGLDLDLSDL